MGSQVNLFNQKVSRLLFNACRVVERDLSTRPRRLNTVWASGDSFFLSFVCLHIISFGELLLHRRSGTVTTPTFVNEVCPVPFSRVFSFICLSLFLSLFFFPRFPFFRSDRRRHILVAEGARRGRRTRSADPLAESRGEARDVHAATTASQDFPHGNGSNGQRHFSAALQTLPFGTVFAPVSGCLHAGGPSPEGLFARAGRQNEMTCPWSYTRGGLAALANRLMRATLVFCLREDDLSNTMTTSKEQTPPSMPSLNMAQ